MTVTLVEGNNTLNIQLTPVSLAVASLGGTVTDADTGLILSGVKVTLDSLVAYTDNSGYYFFQGLTPGNYMIQFSKDGYETLVM